MNNKIDGKCNIKIDNVTSYDIEGGLIMLIV